MIEVQEFKKKSVDRVKVMLEQPCKIQVGRRPSNWVWGEKKITKIVSSREAKLMMLAYEAGNHAGASNSYC